MMCSQSVVESCVQDADMRHADNTDLCTSSCLVDGCAAAQGCAGGSEGASPAGTRRCVWSGSLVKQNIEPQYYCLIEAACMQMTLPARASFAAHLAEASAFTLSCRAPELTPVAAKLADGRHAVGPGQICAARALPIPICQLLISSAALLAQEALANAAVQQHTETLQTAG